MFYISDDEKLVYTDDSEMAHEFAKSLIHMKKFDEYHLAKQ